MERGAVSSPVGQRMHERLVDLFPICRSITGNGVRDTLAYLQRQIPLQLFEVPSGTKVFDWQVPDEWNIHAAFIESESGERVVDFQHSNLHVVNYSRAIDRVVSRKELAPHLFTLPDQPEWIPYRTSYFQPQWGFCMEDRRWQQLPEGNYRVKIDSVHDPRGSLTYGECFLPGKVADEILISCHTCHPSLANDNLSAIVVAAELAAYIARERRRYSYRFLFTPGTIGAIAWLALNPCMRTRTVGGLVLALLGDRGNLTYKRTRAGNSRIDHWVEFVLRHRNSASSVMDYEPFGYNERQFNSAAIQLPVGRLSRAVEGGYPEYHSSADNPGIVTPEQLEDSWQSLCEVVDCIESDRVPGNRLGQGEPQLGRRGLYPVQSTQGVDLQPAVMWTLGLCDGQTSLTEVSNRSGIELENLKAATRLLEQKGLFEPEVPGSSPGQHGQPSSASRQRSRRAHELIPGGSHTYAKGDDQFPSNAPPLMVSGSGCYAFDEDGNRFIEYGMGLRSVGLGHAFPQVVEAATRQMQLGSNFTRPAVIELETAERLLALLPAADMVKFAKNGSDATTAAIRLARAQTGRKRVLVCRDQPFFSVDDWFIGTTPMRAGIPEEAYSPVLRFPYDDLPALEELFSQYSGEFACLIMEAANYREPSPGYLQAVQRLCHEHGALFILDETITGFRWNVGGAQAEYGLDPDLSTFGKAMANGFSVAALAGKREHMELGGLSHERDRVFLLSYTHAAETHALAAAQATMRVYLEEPVIETLHQRGHLLTEGIRSITAALGIEKHFYTLGRGCNLIFVTEDGQGERSQDFRTLLLQELINQGVVAPSLVTSYSHSLDVIERTLDAFQHALAIYARALEEGVEKYLRGPPSKPVFRQRN